LCGQFDAKATKKANKEAISFLKSIGQFGQPPTVGAA
jgi:hypothetical protein